MHSDGRPRLVNSPNERTSNGNMTISNLLKLVLEKQQNIGLLQNVKDIPKRMLSLRQTFLFKPNSIIFINKRILISNEMHRVCTVHVSRAILGYIRTVSAFLCTVKEQICADIQGDTGRWYVRLSNCV